MKLFMFNRFIHHGLAGSARLAPGNNKTYVIIARPIPQVQGLSFLSQRIGDPERKKAVPVQGLLSGEIHINK